jgi:glycosyltransferase involved in cell wall biosynthesis
LKKLAIVSTHPIQYNAPLFKLLTERNNINVKVFYTWSQSENSVKYDPGFKKNIEWDIPLLDGYEYEFVNNTSPQPGSHHFKGIINPDIIERIEAYNPNAILVFGWAFTSHLRVIRYFKNKIPICFRGDSTLLDRTNICKAFARFILLRWIYSHINYALYVGSNNKKYFIKYGLKDKQLIFAPHAIDNNRFANPNEVYTNKAIQWREHLNIRENDLVLIFSGKFELKKNPLFLLDVLKNCDSDYLKIIAVGDGILEDKLRSFAAKDERLIVLDFQNQQRMPVVYRLGDVFILPSVGPGETWGLAVNEAMASGCALMLSEKVGGAIDLVKEGENGIIFNPTDIKKCVDFIEELIDNKVKLTRMKEVSKYLIEKFSFTHIANAIEQLVVYS